MIRQVHSYNATNVDLGLSRKSTLNVGNRLELVASYLQQHNASAVIATLGLPIAGEGIVDSRFVMRLHGLIGSFSHLRHLYLQVHRRDELIPYDASYVTYAAQLISHCPKSLRSFTISNLNGRPLRATFELDETVSSGTFDGRARRSLRWLCSLKREEYNRPNLPPFPLTSLAISLFRIHGLESEKPQAILTPWKDTLTELALDLGLRCCGSYSTLREQDCVDVCRQPPIVMSRLRVLFFSHFGYKLKKAKGVWNFVCPSLRDLTLKGNSHGNSIFYDKFLGDRLESLSVFEEVRPAVASKGLGRFIGLCQSLKILHVVWTGSARKIDQHAEDLIQCLTGATYIPIEQLTLMGSSAINQQSLIQLVKSRLKTASTLRHLCILTRSDIRHWLSRKNETWLRRYISTAILHTCSTRVCCHTERYEKEVERLKEMFPSFQPARFRYQDFVSPP